LRIKKAPSWMMPKGFSESGPTVGIINLLLWRLGIVAGDLNDLKASPWETDSYIAVEAFTCL
jgi:hypothetical protein